MKGQIKRAIVGPEEGLEQSGVFVKDGTGFELSLCG